MNGTMKRLRHQRVLFVFLAIAMVSTGVFSSLSMSPAPVRADDAPAETPELMPTEEPPTEVPTAPPVTEAPPLEPTEMPTEEVVPTQPAETAPESTLASLAVTIDPTGVPAESLLCVTPRECNGIDTSQNPLTVTISDLQPGGVDLWIEANGFDNQPVATTTLTAGDNDLNLLHLNLSEWYATPEPDPVGSVTLEVLATNLPVNSQVCLNGPWTTCETVVVDEVAVPAGVQAFAQVTLATVTFSNLPIGEWQVVLRVPGYQDHFLGIVTVVEGETADGPAVPAGILSELTPTPVEVSDIWVSGIGDDGWWYGFVYGAEILDSGGTIDFGTWERTTENQLRYRPTANQTGKKSLVIATTRGDVTIKVTIGDYSLPGDEGRIRVVVAAGTYNNGEIPAGLDICVSSTDPVYSECQETREEPSGAPCACGGGEGERDEYLFSNVPYGVYEVTLSGGELGTIRADTIVLSADSPSGMTVFLLSNLRPVGTASLTVTVDPGGRTIPLDGYLQLEKLDPDPFENYAGISVTAVEAPTTYRWNNLAPGTYRLTFSTYGYEDASKEVTIETDGTVVHAGTFHFDDLQALPLEATIEISGATWNIDPATGTRHSLSFSPPGLGSLMLTPNQTVSLDSVGTISVDEYGSSFSFTPASAEVPAGTYPFTVDVPAQWGIEGGQGTITVVFGDWYWMPGDGVSVQAPLEMGWIPGVHVPDPITAGTEACLLDPDDGSVVRCVPIPDREPSQSEDYLAWRVQIDDLDPGQYDLQFRNLPDGHQHEPVSLDPITTDQVVWYLPAVFIPLAPPEGEVTVEVDPSSVPEGSQICLVNDETEEEVCQPVTDGVDVPAGVMTFQQSGGTVTLTFSVPPGTWRVILRVPGYLDHPLGSVNVTPNTSTPSQPVPPDILEQLEPDTPVTYGTITVTSEFCKNVNRGCNGRVKDAEGMTVTYTVSRDGEVVQTIAVVIGRSGGYTFGQASGADLVAGVEYTICQDPVPGYRVAPGGLCQTVTLAEGGTSLTFTNIAASGGGGGANSPVPPVVMAIVTTVVSILQRLLAAIFG